MKSFSFQRLRYGKSKGFTLVELVIVIVLTALLAAVALPKMLNLKSDARAALVDAVAGTMHSSAQMSYAKALANQLNAQEQATIKLGNQSIPLAYGFPKAHDGIMQLVNVGKVGDYGRYAINSEQDWVVHYWNWTVAGQQVPAIVIAQGNVTGDNDATAPLTTRCYVRYVQATVNRRYEIVKDTSGC